MKVCSIGCIATLVCYQCSLYCERSVLTSKSYFSCALPCKIDFAFSHVPLWTIRALMNRCHLLTRKLQLLYCFYLRMHEHLYNLVANWLNSGRSFLAKYHILPRALAITCEGVCGFNGTDCTWCSMIQKLWHHLRYASRALSSTYVWRGEFKG